MRANAFARALAGAHKHAHILYTQALTTESQNMIKVHSEGEEK